MNAAIAVVVSIIDIACFCVAIYIYFFGSKDAAQAVFWLVMSISMELSAMRAWRRAFGKDL